jgi:hypothetical protein
VVLRQVIFRDGSSGGICNPYCIEAISTKFVQGFPGLAPRRTHDKDAGAITRVFRFHNDIHDFHHAQLREANPLIDVWLHASCAGPERSSLATLYNKNRDAAPPDAVLHKVWERACLTRRGKAPALACTQSVSGRDPPRGSARVWGCCWGGEPTAKADSTPATRRRTKRSTLVIPGRQPRCR